MTSRNELIVDASNNVFHNMYSNSVTPSAIIGYNNATGNLVLTKGNTFGTPTITINNLRTTINDIVHFGTITNNSPLDGDVWFDGTKFNFRSGGATNYFKTQLSQLNDISFTSLTNNDVLIYISSTNTWENYHLTGALFNSTTKSISVIPSIAASSDVKLTGISNDQLLVYNATDSSWENYTLSGVTFNDTTKIISITPPTLATLSDIYLSSLGGYNMLVYDNGIDKWENYSFNGVSFNSTLKTITITPGTSSIVQSGSLIIANGISTVTYSSPYSNPPNLYYTLSGVSSNNVNIVMSNPTTTGFGITMSGVILQTTHDFNYFTIDDASIIQDNLLSITRTPRGNIAVTFSHSMGNGTVQLIYVESSDINGNEWNTPNLITTTSSYENIISPNFVTNIGYLDGYPMIVTYNNYNIYKFSATTNNGTNWNSPVLLVNRSTSNEIYCFINGTTRPYIFAGSSSNNSYLIYGNDKYGTAFTTVTFTSPNIIKSWVKAIILKSGFPAIIFQDTYTGGVTNLVYWYMNTATTLNATTTILNDISNQTTKATQCELILINGKPAFVYYYSYGATQVRIKLGADNNGTSYTSYILVADLANYINSANFGTDYGLLNMSFSSMGAIHTGSYVVVVLFLVYAGTIGSQTYNGEDKYYTRCYTVSSSDEGNTWGAPIFINSVTFYASFTNGATMQPKILTLDLETIMILYLDNTTQIIKALVVSAIGTGGVLTWTASDKSTNYNTLSLNKSTDVIQTNGNIYFDGLHFNFRESGLNKTIKMNLSEMNDISFSNINPDNIIVYNSTDNKWENYSLIGVIINDATKTITFSQPTYASLPDISFVGLANDNISVYNSISSSWKNYSLTGVTFNDASRTITVSAPSISTCTDVTLASLANDQIFVYNSVFGKWRNYSLLGTYLTFNDVAKTITVASPSIATCTDVLLTGATAGNLLQYDGTKWQNISALPQSYITGLVTALSSKIAIASINIANGICPLDNSGYVPVSNLGNLVTSINSVSGAISFAGGAGMTLTVTGSTLTITNTSSSLATLTDCSIVSPINDSMLIYNTTSGRWLNYRAIGATFNDIAQTVTFLPPAIANSSDVTITSLVANNMLQYNGSKWVNIGSLPQSFISGLVTDLANRVLLSSVGASNGICPLNGLGYVAQQYLSGVVYNLNGLTGNITLAAGAGLSMATVGNSLTITNALSTMTIAGLTDCSINTPVAGNMLIYNSISGKWKNYSTVGMSYNHTTNVVTISALAINSCTDVVISGLANDNLLIYNSAANKWENYTINGAIFDDNTKTMTVAGTTFIANLLGDVNITSPANGDVLQYNSTTSKWTNVQTLVTVVNTVFGINNTLLTTQTSPQTVIGAIQNQVISTVFTDTTSGLIAFINNTSASTIRPTNISIGGVGAFWSMQQNGGAPWASVQTVSQLITFLYDGNSSNGVYIGGGFPFIRINYSFPTSFNLQNLYMVYYYSQGVGIAQNIQVYGSTNLNDFSNLTNVTTGMTLLFSGSGSNLTVNTTFSINASFAFNVYSVFVQNSSSAGTIYINELQFVQAAGGVSGLVAGTDFTLTTNATTGFPDITYLDLTTQNISYNFNNLLLYEAYRRLFPVVRTSSAIKIGTWNIIDSSGTLNYNNGTLEFSIGSTGNVFANGTMTIIGNTSIGGNLTVSGNLSWNGGTTTIQSILSSVTGLNQNLILVNNVIASAAVTQNQTVQTSYVDINNGAFIFVNNTSASTIRPTNMNVGGVGSYWSMIQNGGAPWSSQQTPISTVISNLYDNNSGTGIYIGGGYPYIRINYYYPLAFIIQGLYVVYNYSQGVGLAANIQIYGSNTTTDFTNLTNVTTGMTLLSSVSTISTNFNGTINIVTSSSFNVYSIFFQNSSTTGTMYLNELTVIQAIGGFIGLVAGTDFSVSSNSTTGFPDITYLNTLSQNITYNFDNLLLYEAYRRLYPVVRSSSSIKIGTWLISDISGTLNMNNGSLEFSLSPSGNVFTNGTMTINNNTSIGGDLIVSGNLSWNNGASTIQSILNTMVGLSQNFTLLSNIIASATVVQNQLLSPSYSDNLNGAFIFTNNTSAATIRPTNIIVAGVGANWSMTQNGGAPWQSIQTPIATVISNLYDGNNGALVYIGGGNPFIRVNYYYPVAFIIQSAYIVYWYSQGTGLACNIQIYASNTNSDFTNLTNVTTGMTLLTSYTSSALTFNNTLNILTQSSYNVYSIFFQNSLTTGTLALSELQLVQAPGGFVGLYSGTDFNVAVDATTGYPTLTYINPISQSITYNYNNLLLHQAYNRLYPVVRSTSNIKIGTWSILDTAGTLKFNTTMMTLSATGDLSIAGNLSLTGNLPSISRLSDISFTTLANDNLLVYTASLSKWQNYTISGAVINDAARTINMGSAISLNSDVSLGTLTNNNFLVYNTTSSKWENFTMTGITFNNVAKTGVVAMTSLIDTLIVTPTNDNLLVYNATSSKWQNYSISGATINDTSKTIAISSPSVATCTDVLLTGISNDNLLVYNATSTKWQNYSISGAIINDTARTISLANASIAACSDVLISSLTNDNILVYNNTALKWQNYYLNGFNVNDTTRTVMATGTISTASDAVMTSLAGQNLLYYNSFNSKWQNALGLTTRGDLLVFDTNYNRMPVGTNNQFLIANSSQTSGLQWSNTLLDGTNLKITNATTATKIAQFSCANLTGTSTFNFPAILTSDNLISDTSFSNLSNKTLIDHSNSCIASVLKTGTNNSTDVTLTTGNPIAGQFLIASSSTTAGWSNLIDANLIIVDDIDATKKLQFQLGFITTGTTITMIIPNYSDTIVVLSGSQSLINKTLTDHTNSCIASVLKTGTSNASDVTLSIGNPTAGQFLMATSSTTAGWSNIIDNVFTIVDETDPTKKLQFETNLITTGTTVTLSVPNYSDTIAVLNSSQSLSNKTLTDHTNSCIASVLKTGTGNTTNVSLSTGNPTGSHQTLMTTSTTTATWNTPTLEFLGDVTLSTLSIGHLLYYNLTSLKWENLPLGTNNQILAVNTSVAGSNLQWVTNQIKSYANAFFTSSTYDLVLGTNTITKLIQPFSVSDVYNFNVSNTNSEVTFIGSTTKFKVECCLTAAVTNGTDTFQVSIQKDSGGTITQISNNVYFSSNVISNASIVTISSLLPNDIIYIAATNFSASGLATLTFYEGSLTLTVV